MQRGPSARLKQISQKVIFSLTSMIAWASARASRSEVRSTWNARRCAVRLPIPGSFDSSVTSRWRGGASNCGRRCGLRSDDRGGAEGMSCLTSSSGRGARRGSARRPGRPPGAPPPPPMPPMPPRPSDSSALIGSKPPCSAPPSWLCWSSSAIRSASLIAAMTMSCSISTSSGSTASGSIVRLLQAHVARHRDLDHPAAGRRLDLLLLEFLLRLLLLREHRLRLGEHLLKVGRLGHQVCSSGSGGSSSASNSSMNRCTRSSSDSFGAAAAVAAIAGSGSLSERSS